MDPLSISASVVALLQLSKAIIQLLSTLSSSDIAVRTLVVEVSATRGLLSSLADIAALDEGWNERLREMAMKDGPLQVLETLLLKLEESLVEQPGGRLKQLGRKLTWPFKLQETREMMEDVRRVRSLLAGALALDHLVISREIQHQTKQMRKGIQKLETAQSHDDQEKVLQWLSSTDVSKNHNTARAKHEPTTGDWLINSKSLSLWVTGSMEFMWLHGIPGSGKTVLCSSIIDYIQKLCQNELKSKPACVYYYFDFNDRDRQTLDCFVRSVLVQLSRQSETIPWQIQALYDNGGKQGEGPTTGKLIETLCALLKQFQRIYIIIDALDECREQDAMIDLMSKIKTGNGWSTNLLVTSRIEQQIEMGLRPLVTIPISLLGPVVTRDIQTLVQGVLASDPKLKRRPPALKEEIQQALVQGASGMFRWAACQLDTLRSCLNPSAVRKALQSLPKDLDETYDRILCGIEEESRPIAFMALQFLTFSSRPVRLSELSEMVAIKPRTSIFIDIDRPFEAEDVLVVCSSLVSSHFKRHWIQLAHYSVREYLVSERIRKGPASYFAMEQAQADLTMAERCLTYLLSFDGLEASEPYQSPVHDKLDAHFPLLDYAVYEWSTHARLVPEECYTQIEPLVYRLLDPENNAFYHWLHLYREEEEELSIGTPLHYAAELGLSCTVRRLLKAGVNVNAPGGMFGSALAGAASHGHEDVVRILLEHGADVNVRGGLYDTPLQTACVNRHSNIFHLLISKGADINIAGGYYGCALQAAAARAWPEAAMELLEMGADVNIMNGQFGTALQAASRYGRERLVQELLARGAEVNATGGYYHTALQSAARGGHIGVVRTLLDHGADVHIQGGFCGNALQAAYSRHNLGVAEILEFALASAQNSRGSSGTQYDMSETVKGDTDVVVAAVPVQSQWMGDLPLL